MTKEELRNKALNQYEFTNEEWEDAVNDHNPEWCYIAVNDPNNELAWIAAREHAVKYELKTTYIEALKLYIENVEKGIQGYIVSFSDLVEYG
ncbi:MAG: hypothetical protein ACPGJS_00705 [Flammeovirgaceae bacterium]